jgi:urease accessory protein
MQLSASALLRLMQLVSPALPVGAYSYSQGLEWAIEEGTVYDPDSACRWIHDALHFSVGRFEAPLWLRLYSAWQNEDNEQAGYWNALLYRTRESLEFRGETTQMGYSLVRLFRETEAFGTDVIVRLEQLTPITFTAAFSCAAVQWQISPEEGLLGYLWSWLENQVAVAMKTLPLGQVAGQRMLNAVGATLPALLEHVMNIPDDELGCVTSALAIASSRHETQYCRLFRS